MADGTSFEIDIDAKADSAAEAAVLVSRLADQLDVAEKAASQISAVMKLADASYKAAASGAESASKALEKMNLKVDEQRAKVAKLAEGSDGVVNIAAYRKASEALSKFTAEQSKLAGISTQATAKMNQEAAALDKLRASSTQAAAQVDKITKAQASAKKSADAFKSASDKAGGTGNLGKAASELANLGGPLGFVGSKVFGLADSFGDMKEALGTAGPYAAVAVAIVAIATAVVAVTAAAIAGVATIVKWAVGLADVARTQSLLAAGIAKSVARGKDLEDLVDDISGKVPLTTDELFTLSKPLADAGLKGREFADALNDAANKAAKAKFGPEFQKQMLSLPVQTARLQKNFAGLFSGLRIEKLLEGFSKLVDLFDKSTETGRAIKVVFESLFQPLVDGIVAFIPKMVTGFIQFEILVMKAMIAIKPFGSSILFVAQVFGVLAAIIAAFAVVFVVAVITPITVVILFLAALVAGLMEVIGAFLSFRETLSTMSLSEIGTQMMVGLANGIVAGAGAVVTAITGAVNDAINSAKKLLKIASPSQVFAEIGGHTAAGMSEGVDDGAGDVQSSLESMVAPPQNGPTAAGLSGGKSAGGGLAPIVVNISGVEGAQDIVPALIAALEGWVSQGGGATANA